MVRKILLGTKKAKWDNVVARIDSIQNEQQIMFREQEQRQQRLEQSKSQPATHRTVHGALINNSSLSDIRAG